MVDVSPHEMMMSHLRDGVGALEAHVSVSKETVRQYLENVANEQSTTEVDQ